MAREETGLSPERGSPEGPPFQSLAWAFLGDEDASGPGFMEPPVAPTQLGRVWGVPGPQGSRLVTPGLLESCTECGAVLGCVLGAGDKADKRMRP